MSGIKALKKLREYTQDMRKQSVTPGRNPCADKVDDYLNEIEREIAERFIELPVDTDGFDMPQVTFDWQAIADELNATLGNGTCELVETDSYSDANEVIHVLECSECGKTCEHVNGSYPRCPNCGRKVVRANGDQL